MRFTPLRLLGLGLLFLLLGCGGAAPPPGPPGDVPHDAAAGSEAPTGDASPEVVDAQRDQATADSSPMDERAHCLATYDGVAGTGDVDGLVRACPHLRAALVWVDATNQDVLYDAWSPSMQARLGALFAKMLSGAPLSDLLCPDPRGADADRAPTAAGLPHGFVMELFLTKLQANDLYLASVAHSLALEVRRALAWSLLDVPVEELETLLAARSMFVPVSQPPRPFGAPLPAADYQVAASHVNSMGLVCDPRAGYDFLRGRTSRTHEDLLGATARETLAKVTFFLTQNSVHGFPTVESIDTYAFELAERLHLGLDLKATPVTTSPWIVARVGCHSTGQLLEELARTVNIPLRNVASYSGAWTDGTSYSFRSNSHRGLAYAWSRPGERRIMPHADFTNATALWPNSRLSFGAADYFDLVWRTPESYESMGMSIDRTMPIVPILATNGNGSFETYFDFGRAFAVLTPAEGRYYLRTEACAWDIVRSYCIDPTGGPAALASNHPWGGYAEFADSTLLQAAYDRAISCVAALAGGCSAVGTSYPSFSATNWLPR
ncbi:MAG: hypothetical protein WCI05_13625 [Myxococcales bacterium]